MRIRLSCLLLIFLTGCISYASAIIERPDYGRSAIQSSNIIRTNIDQRTDYDNEAISIAIKELQNKLKQFPDDYLLNISLCNLYLKSRQYDNAYSELVYINNLNKRNKLNEQAKKEIQGMLDYIQKQARYTNVRNPEIYINMAMLSLILNDNEKAEKYILSAAGRSVDKELLLNALTKVFDDTQNYSNAIVACDKILSFNPKDNDVRKIKASYLLQSGNKEGAIDEYSIIAASNPDDESKYELYKLLVSNNVQDKEIIKRIYNSTNESDSLYDLANVLVKNNDLSDARKYTQNLVDKYPDEAGGYILLAEIYRKEGKLQESYDALSKVRDKADSNEAISQYNVLLAKLSDEPLKEANSLMANGLYGQALSVLQSANQESLYVILAQARAYYFLSQKQKALEFLNKAMSFYPNNSDVFCAFGYIYHKENDLDSARKYANKALEIKPDNETAKALLKVINKSEADRYVNNIITSFEAQNYDETMRLINEALNISPDYALLHYYKGLTYIAQNNYAASTASLYKCLELDDKNTSAYFYLAIAFDNLSESHNALTYYQKFLSNLSKDELGESEKVKYAKDRIAKLKS